MKSIKKRNYNQVTVKILGKWFLLFTIISNSQMPVCYCQMKGSDSVDHPLGKTDVNKIIHLNKTITQPVDQPMIMLLWYPHFKDPNWGGITEKTLENGCFLTTDRKLLESAKVVIFSADGLINHYGNDSFPNKYQDQVWIWLTREAPPYHYRPIILAKFKKHIDCWASYRRDSDFVFEYGRVMSKSGGLSESGKVKRISLASKQKSVAWMVSHCESCGGRDDYVKELSKYIDVDIYGYCGSLVCSRDEDENCWKNISNNYKFYLSFENSICKDYFTEKVTKVMDYDIIPIVFGGADYQAILPNNSYINALQFPSPRHLASYLNKLALNEDQYNSYFEWKSHFEIIPRNFKDGFEDTCAAFNGNEAVDCKQDDQDLVDWWYHESQCKDWDPLLRLTIAKFDFKSDFPYGCSGRGPPRRAKLS